MSQRVDISAFKYAVISAVAPRREIVALSNSIIVSHQLVGASGLHIVHAKDIEAFKVNSFVGRSHASSGYVGYDTVDSDTILSSIFLETS